MSYALRQSSRYSGRPVRLFLFGGVDSFGPYAYTDSDQPIVRAGVTFVPWPIKHQDFQTDGTLDNNAMTVSMALGNGLDAEYVAYPPSQIVNLVIFEGNADEAATTTDYPAIWSGRVLGPKFDTNELHLTAVPISSSLKWRANRRNYQLRCPHSLYGPQCRATRTAYTTPAAGPGPTYIELQSALPNPDHYRGGAIEWTNTLSRLEIRTIVSIDATGRLIYVRGNARDVAYGTSVSLFKGCARSVEFCAGVHNNILNFGGQPWLPLENPFAEKNQFF